MRTNNVEINTNFFLALKNEGDILNEIFRKASDIYFRIS